MMMEINGETIKKLRFDLDMNQSEFAQRLGVHWKTVYRWEQGATPFPKHRRKIKELMREAYGSKR